jgi:hypothetical protein
MVVVIFSMASGSLTVSSAQDDMTPTPAPSKTPMPSDMSESAETTEAASADDNPFAEQTLPRSYTQEDLSVLVANVQRPNGIVWLNNNLYTACNGDWTLYEINSETGATITFVYGIQNAHALYGENTDDGGFDLWIPDFDTSSFMRVDETQSAPARITDDLMDGPWGIALLNEEQFLVSNVRSNNLITITREGQAQEAMTGLRSPAGLVREDNYVYVVNNGSARRAIEWFDVTDLDAEEAVSDVTEPLVSGLQNASGLAMGADDYLYFTYALGTRGVVGRVDPQMCREQDGCTSEDVEIVIFTELQAPLAGLTISPDMRLFMHTIYRPEIYWVSLYEG